MANIKTYKITCTNANTAYNVVSGTTTAPTTPYAAVDKGRQLIFQNQTGGSIVKVGDSTVVSSGGLTLDGTGSGTSYGPMPNTSGIQAGDFWVSCDTAAGVVFVQLVKHI